ncbi:hypothetical protein [Actinomadura sp. 21ATH]|uniref:hypothetical protein n=1 Tax=Actinomadura sp. 21ATH TaxID=1735444 RepID=UPI0035C20669
MTARSPWHVPDAGFAPGHLAYLREVVAALPGSDGVLAAIGAGSRAAGLAHHRSDLDVILVFGTEAGRDACDTGAGTGTGRRGRGMPALDLMKITIADLERARDTAAARAAPVREIPRPAYMLGSFRDWALLTRLVTGRVLFAGDRVRGLLDSLDRAALRRDVMTHSALCLAALVEDVAGAAECGDLATALAASEEGLRMSLDAALAGRDDLWVGRKFLQRRMARHPFLADLLNACGHRMFGQPSAAFDGPLVRDTIRWRLELAGHLLVHALLSAWERPVADLPPFVPAGSGPVRDPCHAPVRWAGGAGLMVGVDLVHPLDEEGLLLWSLCDGRGPDDVAARFAARTPARPPGARSFALRTLSDWRARGILLDERPAHLP